jgi:hypothetical protein
VRKKPVVKKRKNATTVANVIVEKKDAARNAEMEKMEKTVNRD